MLALTVSSLATVVQLGFIIGVGLLLDAFIVRTITVPAIAVLAGNSNWWPWRTPRQMSRAAERRASGAEHFSGERGNEDSKPTRPWPHADDGDDGLTDDGGYTTAVMTATSVATAWQHRVK